MSTTHTLRAASARRSSLLVDERASPGKSSPPSRRCTELRSAKLERGTRLARIDTVIKLLGRPRADQGLRHRAAPEPGIPFARQRSAKSRARKRLPQVRPGPRTRQADHTRGIAAWAQNDSKRLGFGQAFIYPCCPMLRTLPSARWKDGRRRPYLPLRQWAPLPSGFDRATRAFQARERRSQKNEVESGSSPSGSGATQPRALIVSYNIRWIR